MKSKFGSSSRYETKYPVVLNGSGNGTTSLILDKGSGNYITVYYEGSSIGRILLN